jgi:hypothetical protein
MEVWSVTSPYRLTPRSHWIGGWVGLRARLDAVENGKISYPCRELNPNSSTALRVARLFTVFFCTNVLEEYSASIFCHKDWGSRCLRNVGTDLLDYTVQSENSTIWTTLLSLILQELQLPSVHHLHFTCSFHGAVLNYLATKKTLLYVGVKLPEHTVS